MKIALFLILLVLIGCDESKIPPVDIGYGHAFVFTGSDAWGNSVFNAQLNTFLKAHPEFKVKSITKLDSNGEKRLVIMDRVLPEITQ